MDLTKLKIVYVPINELKPYENNPRIWSEQSTEQLKQSIRKYGLIDPVICNSAKGRENIVLGGNFRHKVARELGFTKIPVVYVKIKNQKKEAELCLRLNRNTGDWDYNLLKSMDIELLLETGFDEFDLSNIWDDTLETEDDNFDLEKELAKIKTPKTKFGNHYQLGQHRLLCGDSTILESVKKVSDNNKISMIYCDPPYNISLDYNKGLGTKGKYGGQEKDNKTDEEYRNFLKATIENALAVAQSDCHVFYWSDERFIGVIQYLFKSLGLVNRRVCMWIKNNASPTPQIAFNKIYEPCTYATRGNPYLAATVKSFTEIMNKEVGNGNRSIDDIMDLINIWLVKRMPTSEYEHPTSKPPTLHEKALRRCTKPGDTVLDLFGGSGSTLVACEQLKRNCLLIENDPVFCDVIVNRFERLTGIKAKLIK
ncbi:MAG: DNA methyltransferase [Candidatus Paceibacterota bacterium]|jgi:DNA modification methylase